MNDDDALAKRNSETDRPDPGAEDQRPESDDAIRESIRDWSEKLRQVEAIKAAARPARETASALDDLHRLRFLGMEAAERNERQARGLLTIAEQENAAPGDTLLRFVKVARSVRQIVVLEQETMGLRPIPERRMAAAPAAGAGRPSPSHREAVCPSLSRDAGEGHDGDDRERGDLDDLYDYDDRPLEEVLAGVRKVLRVSPDQSISPDVPLTVPSPQRRGCKSFALPIGTREAGLSAMRERGPP